MTTILILSIVWIIYGILGLFGIQNVPKEVKGTAYERDNKRKSGISWLLMGIPYLTAYIFIKDKDLPAGLVALVLIILVIPSIVYSWMLKPCLPSSATSPVAPR